jgi:signal transduction histidine kinase
VLNSVNISATLLADRFRTSPLNGLSQVADLLTEHAATPEFLAVDPKGRQIPQYLKRLHTHWDQAQRGNFQEIESLRKNLEHIENIVSMQQNHAKVGGVVEEVSVRATLEDALLITTGRVSRYHVELIRDFQADVTILVDRHKLLQIAVNLLQNARQACQESGRADPRIIVRVARPADQRVRIEISDNGIGIEPENLTKLFTQGFTTRPHGHGFGLHSSLLAAQEMDGTLSANSAGIGKGASFVLELPVKIIQRQLTSAAARRVALWRTRGFSRRSARAFSGIR